MGDNKLQNPSVIDASHLAYIEDETFWISNEIHGANPKRIRTGFAAVSIDAERDVGPRAEVIADLRKRIQTLREVLACLENNEPTDGHAVVIALDGAVIYSSSLVEMEAPS